MSEAKTASTTFKVVHWIVGVLLFLMMAQPTFDNVRAIMTGTMVMGDMSIDVTLVDMALHVIAMTIGWGGFVLFVRRKKMGAYISIAAHLTGLTAALINTPEMLFEMMPPAAIAVFFGVLFAITLGPIFAFKDEYS